MTTGRCTSPAPTGRLGDGRRRFHLTAVGVLPALLMAVAVGGCVGVSAQPAARSPVPAGPIGQIVADPGASGPPIECRGLARERCVNAGSIEGMVAGIDVADAERVIVSCEGDPCTSTGGAMRIDLLMNDGTTVEVARGGYGEFRQP